MLQAQVQSGEILSGDARNRAIKRGLAGSVTFGTWHWKVFCTSLVADLKCSHPILISISISEIAIKPSQAYVIMRLILL